MIEPLPIEDLTLDRGWKMKPDTSRCCQAQWDMLARMAAQVPQQVQPMFRHVLSDAERIAEYAKGREMPPASVLLPYPP